MLPILAYILLVIVVALFVKWMRGTIDEPEVKRNNSLQNNFWKSYDVIPHNNYFHDDESKVYDPRILKLIKTRRFDKNLSKDFSNANDFRLPKKNDNKDSDWPYYWHYFAEPIIFRIGSSDNLNNSNFKLIVAPVNDKKLHSLFGIIINDSHILIPPLFNEIVFYKKLQIFSAFAQADRKDSTYPTTNYCYYFDTKGRFIGLEQRGPYSDMSLPSYAFDNNTLVRIVNIPWSYTVVDIIDPYNFILSSQFDKMGIMDNIGNTKVPFEYDKILEIRDNNSLVLMQKGPLVFRLSDNGYDNTMTPYASIVATSHQYIKVSVVNFGREVKWGIIDSNYNEVVQPIYDYVNVTNDAKRFLVFKGDFTLDESTEIPEDFIDFKEDDESLEYLGKLGTGKWGIIDSDGTTIVPIEYDWINVYERYYIINKGAEIYYYARHDRKWGSDYQIMDFGGLWGLYDYDGNMLEEPKDDWDYKIQKKYQIDIWSACYLDDNVMSALIKQD